MDKILNISSMVVKQEVEAAAIQKIRKKTINLRVIRRCSIKNRSGKNWQISKKIL